MLNQPLTVRDLVCFVLQNRRGKAFEDWTADELALAFLEGLGKKLAIYCVAPDGQLVGVALANSAPEYKVIHVVGVLTTNKFALPALISKFKELYPDWDLQGYRRGLLVRYFKTEKLVSKILRIK